MLTDNYRIEGVRFPTGDPTPEDLIRAAAAALRIAEGEIVACRTLRRSLDARRGVPCFVFNLHVTTRGGIAPPDLSGTGVKVLPSPPPEVAPPVLSAPARPCRPVVVGAGPAGLFAALTFLVNGIPALVLERGQPVEERVLHVADFWSQGILRTDSNVLFGEGGAGTFSDGKLTTRVRNPYTAWVKQVLVEMGAPPAILVDAKPHIGTDCLRDVVRNLRRRLQDGGCEIRFGAAVADLMVRRGVVAGVVVGEEEIPADCVVFAIGQGAEDTYAMLLARGAHLEVKPFALGLRVEHPQGLIDTIQYGKGADKRGLPPAEYFVATRVREGRSVYSFCMCPGGVVIAASADIGRVVTNGMSAHRRDGPLANSAIVVNVTVDDVLRWSGDYPLAGLAFRRQWEQRAYALGGGGYRAPAQYLVDFLAARETPACGSTSYRPGVTAAPLSATIPAFATPALPEGLAVFGRKMPGFLSREANLVGVETRTSSPLRIRRGEDGQSVTLRGLYPCGEGSGYAGGIVSSALDGIRSALKALGR
ncbi:MAG: hypothetical protein N2Z74_00550 [Syntrophales bacterium]|nr:hypothetical protein [Syntrophales bacterium]